jgi:uncharacterized protein
MYTWDAAKREWNLRQRGLDFADAYLVYENPDKVTLESPRRGENRKLDIALVAINGVVLALVYVQRGDNVHVISFRRASRKERKIYAEAKSQ